MKKIVFALMLAVLLTVTGCGSGKTDTSKKDAKSAKAISSLPTPDGFITLPGSELSDPKQQVIVASLDEYHKKHPDLMWLPVQGEPTDDVLGIGIQWDKSLTTEEIDQYNRELIAYFRANKQDKELVLRVMNDGFRDTTQSTLK